MAWLRRYDLQEKRKQPIPPPLPRQAIRGAITQWEENMSILHRYDTRPRPAWWRRSLRAFFGWRVSVWKTVLLILAGWVLACLSFVGSSR